MHYINVDEDKIALIDSFSFFPTLWCIL